VRSGNGDRVELRATLRTGTRIRSSDVTFEVQESTPSDLQVCTVYKGISACEGYDDWNGDRPSVSYVVDLPKGFRFHATTGNGNVLVMQEVAEVEVTTGNGDVVVRESLSRATARTGNGDVTIAAANGPVRASTGNGRITLTTSAWPIDASTGNGDIDARFLSVPQGRDPAPISFSTGHGDVRVSLPSRFNGEIDASSGHGRISSDFDVATQGRADGSRLRGIIGTGVGPLIKIRSGHGRLEIRKD
jgi:hypothetical protein